MKKFLALTLLCGAMTLSLSAFTQAYESREVFCGPLEVIDHSYTVTIPRSCSQYIETTLNEFKTNPRACAEVITQMTLIPMSDSILFEMDDIIDSKNMEKCYIGYIDDEDTTVHINQIESSVSFP